MIASTGRAQAASLYNLAYYLGSSVLGWAGGLVFQGLGWTALALSVMGLACATAVITAVAHPRSAPAAGTRQPEPPQPPAAGRRIRLDVAARRTRRPPSGAARGLVGRLQRLHEILDDVGRVLQAHRDPQQARVRLGPGFHRPVR